MDDHGHDIESVQVLISKHETFESVLTAYREERVKNLMAVKDQLISANHTQSRGIHQRYNDVMRRWEKLQKDCDAHNGRLQRAQDQFKKVALYSTLAQAIFGAYTI